MVYRGKKIRSRSTGQQLVFLTTAAESGGRLLEMEMSLPPRSPEPPPHFHPAQDEVFFVKSGQLHLRLFDTMSVFEKGDTIRIPRGTVHSMWNASDMPVVVHWQVNPALRSSSFLEEAFALEDPGILDKIALARQYAGEIRFAKPPMVLIHILYWLLYPVIQLKNWAGQA